jgi:hypothetical protein
MFAPERLSSLIKDHGLSEDDLNRPMKREHYEEIAIRVSRDWERLATEIGFEEFEVHDIQDRYREPKDQRIALLRKWKKRYGKYATYAKMVHGLEEINNRELTELAIKLCREYTQRASTCEDKTRKEEQHNSNTSCISTLEIALASVLMCLLPICGLVLDIQTDISITLLGTSYVHYESATTDLWSPNNNDCSQGVGSDLPRLYGRFIGRENDISNVMEKAKEANILNINGAPGFGKSTLAIHVGYRLVASCIPVRYINMDEELSWRTPSEFTDESERRYETEWKSDSKLQDQTTAVAVTSTIRSIALYFQHLLYGTAEPGYQFFDKLKKWSQTINRTTYLIFDNVDVILDHSSNNTKFVDLIPVLVENSKLHLHILVVSQRQLLLSEYYFDRWIVQELNQQASIELLSKLATSINGSQLITIAELLQGCPIALKVVGKILDISGQGIIQELENELQQQPLDVLDKVSNNRQRFRCIMDLIFSKTNFLECGYIMSFFPGSFSKEAGIAILRSNECLEMYERQSLVEEYFIGYQHRYEIHRLIREYLKSKAATKENEFQTRFIKYYTQFLLNYTMQNELNEIDEHVLASESINIHLFKHMLLSVPIRKYTCTFEQLEVFVLLVREGYIEMKSLKQYSTTINNIGRHFYACIKSDLFQCGDLHWTESLFLHFLCIVLVCALPIVCAFPIWFYKLTSTPTSYPRKPIACICTCTCEKITSTFALTTFMILIIVYKECILLPYRLLHIEVVAKWMCRYAVITFCIFYFLTSYCTLNPFTRSRLIIYGVILILILIWSFSPDICSQLSICQ